ncbi:hypothetical protein [Micromonospora vulcania]|uniref:Uncharacterized protein n=1 Tax=Micromonospora vulcania TaxID=1441873 RepID=A0ABW1H0A9_9ACTN
MTVAEASGTPLMVPLPPDAIRRGLTVALKPCPHRRVETVTSPPH